MRIFKSLNKSNKHALAIILTLLICINTFSSYVFATEMDSEYVNTIDEEENNESIIDIVSENEQIIDDSILESQSDVLDNQENEEITDNNIDNEEDNDQDIINDNLDNQKNENEEDIEDDINNQENIINDITDAQENEEEQIIDDIVDIQEEQVINDNIEEGNEEEKIIIYSDNELQTKINEAGTTPIIIYLSRSENSDVQYINANQTINIAEGQNITLIQLDSNIYQRNASFTNTLFQVNGSLTLQDITIDGNQSMMSDNALIVVNSSGVLTLENTKLFNNINSSYSNFGGGVLNYGIIYMNDGSKINNNQTNTYGGGVMNYGTFYMEGGEIASNTSNWYGAGINNSSTGKFYMRNGTINNNNAPNTSYGYGGGIDNTGTFEMSGGSINENTSNFAGGGLSNRESGKFTLSNGSINNNNTVWYGGGIYNDSSNTFTIDNTNISDNNATYYGGGIYNKISSEFIINNSNINNNISTWHGGGIYNQISGTSANSTFTINGGNVNNNKATYDGGGIYNEISGTSANSTFTIDNVIINNNSANNNNGGGIYNHVSGTNANSAFTINNGSINNNKANNGGGIYNDSLGTKASSTFIINDGCINKNTANNNGGGVFAYGTFIVNRGTINDNIANNYGGGILAYEIFEIDGTTIDNNSLNNLDSYGAGICNYAKNFTMKNTIISNNSGVYGGGIMNYAPLQIDSSEIYNNNANRGGGIINYNSLQIDNSKIYNNNANNGGGIYGISSNSNCDLINTVIKNNKAKNGAGGIELTDSSNVTFRSGALYNNIGSLDDGNSTTIIDFSTLTNDASYSLIKACDMIDLSNDAPKFNGTETQEPYIWFNVKDNETEYQDEFNSEKGIIQLRAQILGEFIETRANGLAKARNITKNIEYEDFEKALETADDGDIIEFISTAEDGYKIGIYPAIIDKKITIRISLKQNITYLGDDKTIFKIIDGGNLTIEQPDAYDGSGALISASNAAKMNGEIIIESNGTLAFDSSIVPYYDDTSYKPLTINVKNNGNFIINGYMPWVNAQYIRPLEVILDKDTYIIASDNFSINQYAFGIKFILDEEICNKFKYAEPNENIDDLILMDNCMDENILNKITFDTPSPLENRLVNLINNDGTIMLHKEVILEDVVYINGLNGNDNNSGLSENAPVKSFNKAIDIAKEYGFKTVYVTGEIIESGELNGDGLTFLRYPTYKGIMIRTKSNLTLSNIILDGGSKTSIYENNGSLIYIENYGTVTLNKDTILKNNNVSQNTIGPVYPSYGGGVNILSGTLIINENATIQNCSAEFGGGVAITTQNGRVVMNNGNILNNYATVSGGGIAAVTILNSHTETIEVLKVFGGHIDYNIAYVCGGGIFIQSTYAATIGSEEKNDSNIYICNNEAYGKTKVDSSGVSHQGVFSGGAIYVNGGKMNPSTNKLYPNGEIHLFNVLVTDNTTTAPYGGGIAGCFTSNVKLYAKNGGAIINNKNQNNVKCDIYYCTDFISGSQRAFDESFDISPIMLGNSAYNWKLKSGDDFYLDEMNSYRTIDIYSDFNNIAKTKAMGTANVFITNNIGNGRAGGGGIGTNGNVIIGTNDNNGDDNIGGEGENSASQLTIKKEWNDEDNIDLRPENIEVEILFSIDNGETFNRYGVICIGKDNDWTKTIEVPKQDGDIKYIYNVREINVDNNYYWKAIKENDFSFTIINTLKTTYDLFLEKKLVGEQTDMNKSFKFTIEIDTTKLDDVENLDTEYILEVTNGVIEDDNNVPIVEKKVIPMLEGYGSINIYLGHNDSITIKDLPEGAKIVISEDNKKYTATYVVNNGNVIEYNNFTIDSMDSDINITFTNSLSSIVPTGNFLVFKPMLVVITIGIFGILITKKNRKNKNCKE